MLTLLLPRSLSVVVLLLLGILFAGGNVWFAAVRSTIPLELEGNVTHKRRLMEKTPGIDDVHLVTIDARRRIQVDGKVFDAIVLDRPISKAAWSRTLETDGLEFSLEWSPDFHAMVWAMPLILVVCFTMGILILARSNPNADRQPVATRE